MKKYVILILLITLIWQASPALAKSAYSLSEEGTELYKQGKYKEALEKFIAAQIEKPDDKQISYNLGNAYYKMQDYENAARNYLQSALDNKDTKLTGKSYYNLGNSFVRQHRLQEAIGYYQKTLELDPKDLDAKKNMEFVQKLLEQQQQQQKQEQQDKQKESEDKKEGDKPKGEQEQAGDESKSKEQKEKEKDKKQNAQQEQSKGKDKTKEGKIEAAQEQDEQQEKDKEGKKEAQKAQTVKKLSKEEAQRWLDSLNEDRREFMRRQMLRKKAKTPKTDKDW